MPTLEEVKQETFIKLTDVKAELGITFDDDNDKLTRYIKVAESWLKGTIGENVDTSDERAKQLALLVIEDLYDRNANSVKENAIIQKLKNDFIMQLQCEGRNGTE